jgi:hypothetical protein
MHLSDFATGRDEIRVYCWRHLPKKGVFFKIKDADKDIKRRHPEIYADEKYLVGKAVCVVPLTENAKRNADGNHPNVILGFDVTHSLG